MLPLCGDTYLNCLKYKPPNATEDRHEHWMFVIAQVPRFQSVYTKKGTYVTPEDMDSSRCVFFIFIVFIHKTIWVFIILSLQE